MWLLKTVYTKQKLINLPFKMLNVTGAPVGTHLTSSNPKNLKKI